MFLRGSRSDSASLDTCKVNNKHTCVSTVYFQKYKVLAYAYAHNVLEIRIVKQVDIRVLCLFVLYTCFNVLFFKYQV